MGELIHRFHLSLTTNLSYQLHPLQSSTVFDIASTDILGGGLGGLGLGLEDLQGIVSSLLISPYPLIRKSSNVTASVTLHRGNTASLLTSGTESRESGRRKDGSRFQFTELTDRFLHVAKNGTNKLEEAFTRW